MNAEQKKECRNCGAHVQGNAPFGHCPKCLLELGFGPLPEDEAESPEAEKKVHYFGDYELLEVIGRGGMGVVYRARQLSLHRMVALKMLGSGRLASPGIVQRFQIEAEAAAKLDHPNIVPIYEVGIHKDQHYFTMKLVEGGSLEEHIRSSKFRSYKVEGLSEKTALRNRQSEIVSLVATIARSVHYAHQRGVLHRDLKPSNILLDAEAQPHLTDFGLAKILEHEVRITRNTEVMGTPSYMSPEQAEAGEMTTATDVYSLGAILYEMLTGRPPFSGNSPMAVLQKVIHNEVPDPGTIEAEVDRDLATICLKCLEKETNRRYSSPERLAVDLENWKAGRPIGARPIGKSERFRRWCRREPALAALAGAALLLLLTILIGSPIMAFRIADQRERAEDQARRAKAAVTRLEIERAESLFAVPSTARGVTYLARLLRQFPTNEVVAERLVSALTSHRYFLPSALLSHTGKVTCAQFSPDGELVITASKDATACFWSTRSGVQVGEKLHHAAGITWVEFSIDGHYVVTASEDGTAQVWNVQTHKPMGPPLRHEGPVLYAAFSPDGDRVVTASKDKTARCWNWKSGEASLRIFKTAAAAYFSCFSADGKNVLVAVDDGSCRVFACGNGSQLALFPHRRQGDGAVPFPQFSPEGDRVLTLQTGDAQIWSLTNSHGPPILLPHNHNVTSAVFSQNGRFVATASRDNTARIWDARTGAAKASTKTEDWVLATSFNADASLFLTGTADKKLSIRDARTGEEISEPLQHESGVFQVRFNPNRQQAFAVTAGNDAVLWDIRRLKTGPLVLQHKAEVVHAVFSPDGLRVATSSRDRTARVWNALTGEPITDPLRQSGWINVIRFSPDGKKVATASDKQEVQIWDAMTGLPLFKPESQALRTHIFNLQFSPDGRTIAIATGGGAGGWIADSSTGKVIHRLGDRGSRCIAYSADGSRVINTSGKVARVWDVVTGEAIAGDLRHDDEVYWAEMSRDGRRVATASRDKTVRIWDAYTGQPVCKPLLHADALGMLNCLQFSPDGKLVATAAGKTSQVWDAETGKPSTFRLEHDTPVNSVRFSPDCKRLITSTAGGDARVWDVKTGHALSERFQHRAACVYAEFSPDGQFALTASEDGKARIWWVPQLPLLSPEWLPDLAESLSGSRMDDTGVSEIVPVSHLFELAHRLGALSHTSDGRGKIDVDAVRNGNGFYSDWVRWFLSADPERSPFPSRL